MEIIWDQEYEYDKNASWTSLKRKLTGYGQSFQKFPNYIRAFSHFLIFLSKNPSLFLIYWRRFWKYFSALPIISFYSYLWKESKGQLFMNLFVSYIMPLILENMPWYFSRRKLGRILRNDRNTIYNSVIRKGRLDRVLGCKYIFWTLWHVLVMSFEMHIKNRVALKDKFLVKRLILQRLLYSEIDTFSDIDSKELEVRITHDINRTLRLFSFVIPQTLSNIYAIIAESRELYEKREKLDWIAVLRPVLASTSWTILDWIKMQVFGESVSQVFITKPEISRLFHNAIEGIVDIQVNNLQEQQIDLYDQMLEEEFSWYESCRYFVNRTYRGFTSRGAVDFISTMFVTDLVMKRRNMNYEEYRRMQMDIDHLRNLGRRTFNQFRTIKRTLESQHQVATVLNSPNFQEEDKIFPNDVYDFEELVLRDIVFSYYSTNSSSDITEKLLSYPKPPYALNFTNELVFNKGHTYGIIGQNRSGKSTLVKLICKLYHPQLGSIFINGIDYKTLKRKSLRNLISYISQKPYIFPGTIKDNILIGNPNATEDELIYAAASAGIFSFDEMLKQEEESRRVREIINRVKRNMKTVSFDQIKSMTQKRLAELEETKTMDTTVPVEKFIAITFEERLPIRVTIGPSPRKHVENRPISLSIKPNRMLSKRGPIKLNIIDLFVKDKEPETLSRERQLEILNMPTKGSGKNVSGGFAQSIALSRVFLNTKAKLVILDESMSAMDPIKKRSIIYPALMNFINRYKMTMLLISHDMTCVDYVDEVILLEAGRIVAQGSHKELKRVKSKPYMQMLGAKI